MGINALIRKFEQFTQVTDEDKRLIQDAAQDVRTYDRCQDIIREGDNPDHVHLMLEGWAARYKSLSDGKEAILPS